MLLYIFLQTYIIQGEKRQKQLKWEGGIFYQPCLAIPLKKKSATFSLVHDCLLTKHWAKHGDIKQPKCCVALDWETANVQMFLQEKGNNPAVCTMLPSYTVEEDSRPWKSTFLSIKPTILLTAFYMIFVNPVPKNLCLHCKTFIFRFSIWDHHVHFLLQVLLTTLRRICFSCYGKGQYLIFLVCYWGLAHRMPPLEINEWFDDHLYP